MGVARCLSILKRCVSTKLGFLVLVMISSDPWWNKLGDFRERYSMSVIEPEDSDIRKMAMALEKQRAKTHGDMITGARRTGRVWGALLSEHLGFEVPDIPPHMVNLMFAAAKLNRAARPRRLVLDDYIDGINYVTFSWRARAQVDTAYPHGAKTPERKTDETP